jgi:FkbM family methyltransferase
MFARLCGDLPARLGYASVAPADHALAQVVGLDVAERPRYITRHYPPLLPRQEHAFAARLRDAGFAPASIVDVGAADGGWTRNLAPLFPSAQVSLFEPLADIAPKYRECLDELCAAFPNVKLSTFALGETGGRQLLLVTPQPEQSTCLPAVAGTQYVRGEPVPMLPLDMALRKFQIPPPALLKIAVSGFELQVLKGARQTLAGVEVLFLETWLQRGSGEGCALLPEVVAWLAREGLFLAEILDEGEHRHGLPISRRVVFMRENNRYFADFGARRFALEPTS